MNSKEMFIYEALEKEVDSFLEDDKDLKELLKSIYYRDIRHYVNLVDKGSVSSARDMVDQDLTDISYIKLDENMLLDEKKLDKLVEEKNLGKVYTVESIGSYSKYIYSYDDNIDKIINVDDILLERDVEI